MEDISILKHIRKVVLGIEDNKEFDRDLILHINSAIVELNQAGIGNTITVTGEDQTWNDLKRDDQVEGNKRFNMIPLFISTSTALIFDPPPPSNVEYYSRNVDKLLWRLKVAYEEDVYV